jgi:hypothetical protein
MTLDFQATSVILLADKRNCYWPTNAIGVCSFIGGIMAKKAPKRREWTKADVRELKTLARNKTPAPMIAPALKRTLARPKKGPTSVSLSEIRRAVRAVNGTI